MKSDQQRFNYDAGSNEIVKHLVFELNKLRRQSKYKRLYRSKLGDSVALALHERGVKTEDQIFARMLEENGLVASNSEFTTLEAKLSQHHAKDAKQNFMELLGEKVGQNSTRAKFVTSNVYTHISMALKQTGLNGDVFQIGVLLFKADMTIEKIFECQQGEGTVIVGRVLDSSLKPCMAVLNRDENNLQCVVGPNRIYFDPSDGDEYKIHVPNNYLSMNRHPLLDCALPTIEIFRTQTSNRQLKLCNAMDVYEKQHDIDQSIDPLQMHREDIQIGIRSFLVPVEDFKGLSMSMSEALDQNTSLLDKTGSTIQTRQSQIGGGVQSRMPAHLANRLNNKTAIRTFATSDLAGQSQTQIRKTKAQILKEQNAAAKLSQQPQNSFQANRTYMPQNRSPSFSVNRFQSNSGVRDFGVRTTNSQNRFQAPFQTGSNPFQSNNSNINNAPRNALNCTFANSTLHKSPNNAGNTQYMQSAISSVSVTPRQVNQNQSTNWNKPMNQAFTPVSNNQIKFEFQSQQQRQPQSTYQQPSFPKFQPQVVQTQGQWPMQSSNFQPAFNPPNFGSNQQAQTVQAPQPQFVQPAFKPIVFQPAKDLQMQAEAGQLATSLSQKCNETPLPVRFAVNGTQSKRFDSKKSHHDAGLLPLRTQLELDQQKLDYYSLCESDQLHLKNCLHELVTELKIPQEEQEGARKMMLTNPMQFHAFYQHAAEICKLQENHVEKVQALEEQKPFISVQDFSDTHLFLINFAEKLCSSSKYIDKPKNTKQILQQVSDPEDEMTAQKGLEQIILSRAIPRNDGFVKLYSTKSQPTDLTFNLQRQKYKCHQFVLQQSGDYMKEAMRKNQQRNMQQCGQPLSTMTFDLPDWVAPSALENYIRYSYTTEFKLVQTSSSASRTERPQESLELFRLACYFHCYSLQECLLAREIFPNMNAYSAVCFLQEIYHRDSFSPCKREPSERVKAFLQDYCMFYLSKNLPVILRREMQRLLSLPSQVIHELVKTSLFYIVDARADIEVLLEFAASVFAEKDIFKLFNFVQERVVSCCGFDQQHIPQISQITQLDPQGSVSTELIEGFDYDGLNSEDQSSTKREKLRDSCALDSSQIEQITSNKVSKPEKLDHSSASRKQFGPQKNVLVFADGQSDTGPIRDPSFVLEIELNEQSVAQHIGSGTTGLSFFSQAFDVARRSWHLKIDIAQPSGEISLWLVERGEPCTDKDALQVLRRSLPIKFTSQLMELQIVDPGLKDRKSVIFFSYSHDSHQIIGHKNFANMDQLTSKDKIKVHVKIFEHILHSAMMHYFAQTFQRQFKNECALEQTIKMCGPHSQKSNNGLLAQPVYMPYWLLSSDLLKVEDENTVLSFIFHYSNLLKDKTKSLSEATFAVDQLTKCLRFNYCDLHNLMSAIRKSLSIQHSSVMTDSFKKEVKERLKLKKPGLSRVFNATSGSHENATQPSEHPEVEHHFCGRARKYYILQKIEGQGRSKLLESTTDAGMALIDEITQWAFQSRIIELNDQQTRLNPYQLSNQQHKDETIQVRVLNHQLAEEKQKVTRIAQELQDYQRKYQTLLQVSNQNQAQPIQKEMRHQSPPKYVPQSLKSNWDEKENIHQPKLGVVGNNNAAKVPLYVQNQEPLVPSRRDPPAMLGGRREPPATLANKALSQKSFNSDQLLNNSLLRHDATKVKGPPASLNLSMQPMSNPQKRAPPASLGGGGQASFGANKSMDLTQIMNQINASPAPKVMRRKPGGANPYLVSKSGKEHCAIF